MIKVNDKNFVDICKGSPTMAQAAVKLGLHYNTFKKYAIKLKCFKPNPSGKGVFGEYHRSDAIPLDEILKGNHPSYQTYKLRQQLIKNGLKKNQCEICQISNWNGKALSVELDHIDGNRSNHLFSNLRMLCPNCHSQTSTFRSKKR